MDLDEFKSQPIRSVRDLAAVLGTGINGTYQAVKRGVYPSIRQGKRILIPTAPIVAMLEGNTSGGEPDEQR